MDIIFAGGKFRAKSKFANIAKISSTRKIGVIQYPGSTLTDDGELVAEVPTESRAGGRAERECLECCATGG